MKKRSGGSKPKANVSVKKKKLRSTHSRVDKDDELENSTGGGRSSDFLIQDKMEKYNAISKKLKKARRSRESRRRADEEIELPPNAGPDIDEDTEHGYRRG